MQDRYLCRGKRLDDGKMIEGHLIQTEVDGYVRSWISVVNDPIRLQKLGKHFTDWRSYEVETDTVCRCTGRKDKYGELIWENDIIKDNVIYGVVKWDDENVGYIIDDREDGYQVYSGWWHEVTVIGNAFDNPGLLEEQNGNMQT